LRFELSETTTPGKTISIFYFPMALRRILLRLENAVLAHPGDEMTKRKPINLTINPPSLGGHVILGRNGAGKSLLSSSLVNPETFIRHGSLSFFGGEEESNSWARKRSIAHVSFESHKALLAEDNSMTTFKTISGGVNQLSKAAQFLVVRFGLFPLLPRPVHTLSTGEIRKVMIVRALAQRPHLLVLDNAFDGLDVEARDNLKDLISRTIQGFRIDILVQAVSAKDAEHTQVLLLTNRHEEIVDEIQSISYFKHETGSADFELFTVPRQQRSSEEILQMTIGESNDKSHLPWEHQDLPSVNDIKKWWGDHNSETPKTLITAHDLTVQKGDATLLKNINWAVHAGERWLVAGGNGAGKSTLSRLITSQDGARIQGKLEIAMDKKRIGWCSTELHMKKVAESNNQMAKDILIGDSADMHDALTVASWLGLDETFLLKPFSHLSQGQQKLVLIAAALACRPQMLVLDEPCQGLDVINRRLVLGLVERFCQATDSCLIYITHHSEEVIPSVTNILHLKQS